MGKEGRSQRHPPPRDGPTRRPIALWFAAGLRGAWANSTPRPTSSAGDHGEVQLPRECPMPSALTWLRVCTPFDRAETNRVTNLRPTPCLAGAGLCPHPFRPMGRSPLLHLSTPTDATARLKAARRPVCAGRSRRDFLGPGRRWRPPASGSWPDDRRAGPPQAADTLCPPNRPCSAPNLGAVAADRVRPAGRARVRRRSRRRGRCRARVRDRAARSRGPTPSECNCHRPWPSRASCAACK